ncbi:MAG: hypothetical protein AAF353_18765 [Pseudomonadota bacterium]
MDRDSNTAVHQETSQLLEKLDNLIDQSSALQEIVRLGEKLHRLEKVTGPCYQTELIRLEIAHKESKLKSERRTTDVVSN